MINRASSAPNFPCIDFHAHCLPGMDDGAKNVQISCQMLNLLAKQGVSSVIATPHFYAHRESVSDFVARRDKAFSRLMECLASEGSELPAIILGAEVRLERGLSEKELNLLCSIGTDMLLMELPWKPFSSWMAEEIWNSACTCNIRPVIAHIERYISWYSKEDYDAIFSLPDCIFQVNAEAFSYSKTLRLIYEMMDRGCKIVVGSDCHDMDNRPPDFSAMRSSLQKNRKGHKLLAYLRGCVENISAKYKA